MRKILVFILVLTLILGTFTFAYGISSDLIGDDRQEAISSLMVLGVVNGYPDGTFKPDNTLKRGEMAKLLVTTLGYNDSAGGGYSNFSDTRGHWAESYISVATSTDLVLGYPDGTFRPEATLTMEESITMIVRALGYTDKLIKGDWPNNYLKKASDLFLTNNIPKLTGDAPRGQVALMIYNALDRRMIEILSTKDYSFVKNNRGEYVLLVDKIGKKIESKFIGIEDVAGERKLDSAFALEKFLFHRINYYANNQGDIAYLLKLETKESEGILIDKTTNSISLKDTKSENITFENINSNTPFLYNGAIGKTTKIKDLSTKANTEMKVIYNDNKEVQGIIAWEFEVERITHEYTSQTPLKINGPTGFHLPKNNEGALDQDALTIEGDVDSLEEIKKGDIVYYYASDDNEKVTLSIIRDSFIGTYTKRLPVKGEEDKGVFDGIEFQISDFTNKVDLKDSNSLEKTYKLILDKEGNIFDWEIQAKEITNSDLLENS